LTSDDATLIQEAKNLLSRKRQEVFFANAGLDGQNLEVNVVLTF
jgi:hypothetical protein